MLDNHPDFNSVGSSLLDHLIKSLKGPSYIASDFPGSFSRQFLRCAEPLGNSTRWIRDGQYQGAVVLVHPLMRNTRLYRRQVYPTTAALILTMFPPVELIALPGVPHSSCQLR